MITPWGSGGSSSIEFTALNTSPLRWTAKRLFPLAVAGGSRFADEPSIHFATGAYGFRLFAVTEGRPLVTRVDTVVVMAIAKKSKENRKQLDFILFNFVRSANLSEMIFLYQFDLESSSESIERIMRNLQHNHMCPQQVFLFLLLIVCRTDYT
jgi:hypothetical protein